MGRDSMSAASRTDRTRSRSAPKAWGSMRMQVSQWLPVPSGVRGMNETPGRPANPSAYTASIRRRRSMRLSSPRSWALPRAASRLERR